MNAAETATDSEYTLTKRPIESFHHVIELKKQILNNTDRQTAGGKDKKTRRGPGRENDKMTERENKRRRNWQRLRQTIRDIDREN